jgi:hypothetical protein
MLLSRNVVLSVASLVLLAAVAGGSYAYYANVLHPAPCAAPKTYSIGAFDPKFGISRADFLDAMQDAAAVWNTAAGKAVLAYDVSGTLPVNLMYDTRQEAVELRSVIDAEQAAYESKAASVEAARAALKEKQQVYESLKASIEARRSSIATPADRTNFNRDVRALNATAQDLNAQSRILNEQIAELNLLAAKTNAKVETYNTANVHTDFDQGRYVSDDAGERITIYEFENKAELTRALAHEFGHALGLDHNENPKSIMYPYNKGGGLELSDEDLAAFREACALTKN